jgi:putative transposase
VNHRSGSTKNNFLAGKFSWQDDYFAVSISESQVAAIVGYIKNQETHHLKKSFTEEVDEFMKKYNWEIIKD